MKIPEESFQHVQRLAALGTAGEEAESLRRSLEDVLTYMQRLGDAPERPQDTPARDIGTLRPDTPEMEPGFFEAFLQNVPETRDGVILLPAAVRKELGE